MKNVTKMIAVLALSIYATGCHSDQLVKSGMKEASAQAEACGMDQGKLFSGFAFGGNWIYDWAGDIVRNANRQQKQMKALGLRLEFGYDEELKGRCKLSENALVFNAGSMAVIRILQATLDDVVRSHQSFGGVKVFRLVITSAKGKALDRLNDESQPYPGERGEGVLDIYVNTGEYETPYSITGLIQKAQSYQDVQICPM